MVVPALRAVLGVATYPTLVSMAYTGAPPSNGLLATISRSQSAAIAPAASAL